MYKPMFAAALLASNPNLPRTVRDYAAGAVKHGSFPRGRGVPGA